MLRIGLISDTHGFLDERVAMVFAGVAHVLHAGDVGRLELLRDLARIAPVTAVAGNTDACFDLPRSVLVEVQALRFHVQHVLDLRRLAESDREQIERANPDVVVFGHTHRPCAQWLDGRLYVNPGSAGRRRFDTPRSVAVLVSSVAGLDVDFHTLGE